MAVNNTYHEKINYPYTPTKSEPNDIFLYHLWDKMGPTFITNDK